MLLAITMSGDTGSLVVSSVLRKKVFNLNNLVPGIYCGASTAMYVVASILELINRIRSMGFGRNYWVILTTWVFIVFGSRMASTYMSNYVYLLGGSERLVGYVLGVAAIPTAFARIIGGIYSDVRGRRTLIVRYTWVLALTSYLTALAPNWQVLLLALLLNSVTLVYAPALQATFAESMPPGRRTVGFLYASIIPELASVLAPLIGGYITSVYGVDNIWGYRLVLLLNAVLLTIVAVLRHLFLEETIEPLKIRRIRLTDEIRNVYELIKLAPRWLKEYLLLNYVLLSIPVSTFTFYGIRYVIYRGYDNMLYGVIVASGIAVSLAATLYMTLNKVCIRDTRLLGFIVLAMSGGIALFSIDGFPLIIVGGVLVYSSIILRFAVGSALLHEYIGDRLRGRIASFTLASLDLSSFIAGVVSGTLYPISPFHTLVSASVLALAAGTVFVVKPIKPSSTAYLEKAMVMYRREKIYV